MKRITLFFIVCLLSANSIAQKIASSILLQDGTIIDSSHIFMDGEEPTFYVKMANMRISFGRLVFLVEMVRNINVLNPMKEQIPLRSK